MIEHFAGAFPTWLAPVQVEVIPISDKHLDYANKVLDTLKAAGIRADIDTRKAANMKTSDYEDAIQMVCAQRMKVDFIELVISRILSKVKYQL